jgi:DNA-binding NtrC family response regulator
MKKGISIKEAGRQAAFKAERPLLLDALTKYRWNRLQVAEELGVSYKTLLRKIAEHKL